MIKLFKVNAKVWLYPGKAAWHFVSVPKEISENIDFYFSDVKKGWGSLPVLVTLNDTSWKTSIFPDKKTEEYLLPLKKQIREQEHIAIGDVITFSLKIVS